MLLDPPTKALLALRASKERRAKEARFLDLIKSCEKLRREDILISVGEMLSVALHEDRNSVYCY